MDKRTMSRGEDHAPARIEDSDVRSLAVPDRPFPVHGPRTGVVGRAPPQPAIQLRSMGEQPSNAQVHAAAARAVSGGSGRLPFLDKIQAAFGEHDASRIEAHTDAAAREGSVAMGAQAFAMGNHVAFARSPDLHTAAHEAAHVVQQRAGVQLSGGVGHAGDAYEHMADAIADRVVRGESAADLLPASPGGGAAGPAIQRKPDPEMVKPISERIAQAKTAEAAASRLAQQQKQRKTQLTQLEAERKVLDQGVKTGQRSKYETSGKKDQKQLEKKTKEIDALRQELNELKRNEKAQLQQAATLKQEAIDLAIKAYQVDVTKAKEIVYDSAVSGEGVTIPGDDGEPPSIYVGNKAFSSPAILGSTLAHEAEIHVGKQGRHEPWYPGPVGTALQEVEAYDFELDSAERFGMNGKDLTDIQGGRTGHYNQLTPKYQKRADAKKYYLDKADQDL